MTKYILYLFFALAILSLSTVTVNGEEYVLNVENCVQTALGLDNDILFVTCYTDNAVLKIDVNTLQEIGRYNVLGVGNIKVGPLGNHIYVDSVHDSHGLNSELIRINIANGTQDSLTINGELVDFYVDPDNQSLWLLHRTYPISHEPCSIEEALFDYPNSGFISKVNLSTFSLVQTVQISVLPMSIWYSDYSDKLYVCYKTTTHISDNPGENLGCNIQFYTPDLNKLPGYTYGGHHTFGSSPALIGCNWDDQGRYFAIPNPLQTSLDFSLRVIDTVDNSIVSDLSFPDPINSKSMQCEQVKKVPGQDYIWILCYWGYTNYTADQIAGAIKLNTNTLDYELFILNEVNFPIGYFDVSQDGRTLYIPQPAEGSIIVTSPGNHAPVCDLLVVTPRPHTGPSPVAVEFDASGTYDDDGDTLTFHWDFDGDKVFDEPIDDAYTGTPANPTHEYTADYDGAVNLRVTDNYQGECDTAVILSVDVE